MRVIRTIAIDDPSVCQSVTWFHCGNTAEWIQVLFGVDVETLGAPKEHHTGASTLRVDLMQHSV